VFFSGISSTRSVGLISLSAILFGIHLTLRLVRFGENPYSFFVLENVIDIANALVFILINSRLLFRDTLGVLFPAIVIARLVGLASSRR
jgi:hypothetical protein